MTAFWFTGLATRPMGEYLFAVAVALFVWSISRLFRRPTLSDAIDTMPSTTGRLVADEPMELTSWAPNEAILRHADSAIVQLEKLLERAEEVGIVNGTRFPMPSPAEPPSELLNSDGPLVVEESEIEMPSITDVGPIPIRDRLVLSIVRLTRAGMTPMAIAKELNCTVSDVQWLLSETSSHYLLQERVQPASPVRIS